MTTTQSAAPFPDILPPGDPGDAPRAAVGDGIVCRPAGLGWIRVSGEDAGMFLHSQLTNAIEDLDAGTARLSGYCSAKGRLLASFLVWRDAHGIVLQLSADIEPAIRKRLSMFVLRAKAKLTDLGAECTLLGVAGPAAATALDACGLPAPAGAWQVATADAGTVVRLPDVGGLPRWQVLVPSERADALETALAGHLRRAPDTLWDWLDIHSGVPRIALATQEQFVPQMINLELIGGVNFRKGCYPGQEVVARSQYRGTLKRRMWLVQGEGETPAAAAEIFSASDPRQPSGMLVNAAPAPAGGWSGLAELKIDAAASPLTLGAPDGPALKTGTLPYAVPLAAGD